ncbi:MAG: hypothetical protein OEY93_10520 [Anaerolineae bacterium]|nr:hypothetical protein [Anaerolineae bacterium]
MVRKGDKDVIDLKELQKATNRIFDHLYKQNIYTVELEKDYYWHIEDNELYVFHNGPPKDLTAGQLFDDLEIVEKIAKGTDEPIGHALVWVASLFRYIGEKHWP